MTEKKALEAFIREVFEKHVPFNQFLGIEIVAVERGYLRMRLPFRKEFVGDPTRPALHGGVISSLIDTAGGAAAWTELQREDRLSTVDILIDYLAPAGMFSLEAEARVVRIGNRVAVVQIHVFQEGNPEMIAQGRAVYNIFRPKSG